MFLTHQLLPLCFQREFNLFPPFCPNIRFSIHKNKIENILNIHLCKSLSVKTFKNMKAGTITGLINSASFYS